MTNESVVEHSATANLVDLKDGQIVLSRFIVKRDDGVYVDLSRIGASLDFFAFVDRVFSAGTFFRALDYPSFFSLLYEDGLDATERTQEVRFAADVVSFQPERQALYKMLKIENGVAEYQFESVFLESVIEEGVFGDLAGGGFGLIRVDKRTVNVPTRLDVDEFVAVAWQHGVRYGLDYPAISAAIRNQINERLVIARPLPLKLGRDAEIREQATHLRRDNAPRQLPDGRIDLRQFQNRYPQVVAGESLVRKNPRVLGVDGRAITGEPLLAPLPKDIDLLTLSGPGTRVVQEKGSEQLIAAVGGFLNIDTLNHQFSITDKIVNREGVSIRTTGDLSLTGDEFEEFGEIQEKRTVECRSITAHSDVFGTILSHGGTVSLRKNVVGGRVTNEAGDIVVDGLASGAVLIAPDGCVTVNRAESCLIIARVVVLGNVTRCDVLADEVLVERAEGCAIAGKTINALETRARGEIDCVFSLLIPDLSEYQGRIDVLKGKRTALELKIEAQRLKSNELRGQKDVARYLALANRLQRRELALNDDQLLAWQKLTAQVGPSLRALAQLGDYVKTLDDQAVELSREMEELQTAEQTACDDVACNVRKIGGETRIRGLRIKCDEPPLATLTPKELKLRLRIVDGAIMSLFSGSGGSFDWHYKRPDSRGTVSKA